MNKFGLLLLLWVCASAADDALPSEPVPLEDFARIDGYSSASLSPDGAYVALLVPIGEQVGLAVIDLAANKVISRISVGENRSVLNFVWAGSRRMVVALADNFSPVEYPVSTGELFGVDVDGKNSAYLFGFRGESQIGTHIAKVTPTRGSARIVRALLDDPDRVLISVHYWQQSEDSEFGTTYLMNVHNGLLDHEISAPISGPAWFAADRQGFVRYAVVEHSAGHLQTFARTPAALDWKAITTGEMSDTVAVPIGLSKDAGTVYLSSDEGGDFRCLVKQNLTTGERSRLSCKDGVDLNATLFSLDDDRVPVAAEYEGERPTIEWLDSGSPSRSLLQDLQKAFPGQLAWPVSRTHDGGKALIEVDSDRNPGDYYLLDTRTHKAAYLISCFDWIDPDRMAMRTPVAFEARDGQLLHGVLTLPKSLPSNPAQQALVVMPHGGPFGIRDTWYWERDAQALASRGYAVLQVNFRGSGGFGKRFELAGRQGWNHVLIDDITDGTRWAIKQGYADPKWICIYGASYGGYAALMSAVREPDLYRCTIGYAGVYDLGRWKRDSDVGESEFGRNYISDFVGADAEALAKASPINYLEQLKAAVMIIHGEEDERAPYSQAKLLRAALDKRKYPYVWLVRPGEAHGFILPKNRLALYEQVIAFLDKNIGTQAQDASTSAPAIDAISAPK
ncbi:MAG: Prolyl oligopeptidase family protein [Nevskia sp.]|nr:Prolyl oligopeptidase family protein [Nevskia sp.]